MKMFTRCGRRELASVLLTAVLLLSQGLGAQAPASPSSPSPALAKVDEVHQLWTTYISPMLAKPIPSNSNDSYYAGEELMVPLHAAFKRRDAAWEQEFSDHFRRLVHSRSSLTDVILSRLEYLYLASRFLVLAKNAGRSDLIPGGLDDMLFSEIRDIWYQTPAPQYAHPPFKGMKALVLFKLDHRDLGKSYYRAIKDEELVIASIAADLRAYYGFQRAAGESTLNDILSVTERICRQEVVHTSGGGWVFQPGARTDHPDFQYAGNPRIQAGLRPAPVQGIGSDSSHFSKWPLFLQSLTDAYPEGSSQNRLYSDLEAGLNRQFFGKVLVAPSGDSSCYRTKNFMDGSNGVYRWGYGSLGPNNGYGPYQNSAALVMGWWSFLGTEESRSLFRKLADQYPWPEQCVDLYLGPSHGGIQRPKSELSPDTSTMKLKYLFVRLASDL